MACWSYQGGALTAARQTRLELMPHFYFFSFFFFSTVRPVSSDQLTAPIGDVIGCRLASNRECQANGVG
jgi:hypothetical protein